MDNHPRVYKGLAVALACNALEVEVNGALAADVIPLFVFDADQALEDGRALARDGNYEEALTTCSEHIPELLLLNHPLVFEDSFENSDTRLWSHTEVPIIVVD